MCSLKQRNHVTNNFTFSAEFTSEESCRLHFKAQRDKLGVTCQKCGHDVHYWIQSRWSYECQKCHSRMTLKSGNNYGAF